VPPSSSIRKVTGPDSATSPSSGPVIRISLIG
jgi:hypothetical protein